MFFIASHLMVLPFDPAVAPDATASSGSHATAREMLETCVAVMALCGETDESFFGLLANNRGSSGMHRVWRCWNHTLAICWGRARTHIYADHPLFFFFFFFFFPSRCAPGLGLLRTMDGFKDDDRVEVLWDRVSAIEPDEVEDGGGGDDGDDGDGDAPKDGCVIC